MPRIAFFAALLLIVGTMEALAGATFPRASGIGLDLPPGMKESTEFMGFQLGFTSILITELPPAAYAQMNGDRARMAATIEGAKTEDFSVSGTNGFIIRGRQRVGSRLYLKWAVVLDGQKETALVTVQVPVDANEVTAAAVESALRTIVFRDPPGAGERRSALPFTIGNPAGFRPTGTLMGVAQGFTEGPKDIDPDHVQPHVVVSTSLNHPPAESERLAFAERVMRSLTSIREAEIRSVELLTTNGAQWAELRATGRQGRIGTPIDVFLFIRFGTGSYILVVGTAPAGGTDYADRFRQLALSVAPKD